MMRPIIHLLVFLIIMLGQCSCASRHTAATLNDVETYIQQRPDSALATIRAIDTTTLTTRSLRAHYALLYAMALDKNWIDTTDVGVVMPAVEYYGGRMPVSCRAKPFYYLGRIHFNGGNYSDAIVSFTHAEEYAEKLKDDRFKSLIFQAMGDTYGMTYLPREALACTDSSIKYCLSAGDTSLAFASLHRKAQILNNLKRYSEADSLLSVLLDDTRHVMPVLIPEILADKALVSIQLPSGCDSSVVLFEQVLSDYGRLPGVNYWCAYAYSLSATGKSAKANQIFKQLEKAGLDNTYSYKTWKGKADIKNGDYQSAALLLDESTDKQSEKVMETLRQSAVKAQRDYYAVEKSKAESSRRFILIISILSGLFLLVLMVAAYLLLKRKHEQDREKSLELEQENASLQEAVTALSDKVTEKNVQQAQLQREYTVHLQSSFREWGQLYKAYYHPGKMDILDIRDNVYYEARKAVSRLSGDKEGQMLLERRLNEVFDNVMTHYRLDFPDREEADYHFVSFVFAGFYASVLTAAFQIPSLPATYERKARLKDNIIHSSAENKDQYLRFFR